MKKYSTKEWEDICRRCGKCCLIKLQDEETEDIYYTNVVCKYFDEETVNKYMQDVQNYLTGREISLKSNAAFINATK